MALFNKDKNEENMQTEESALEAAEKKSAEVDLPGQISGKQLKFGYWFTTNRLLLRKILTVFLIVLAVLLWSYVGYRLIMIYAIEDQGLVAIERILPKDLVNYEGYKNQYRAEQMKIVDTDILSTSSDRHDLFAKVSNPNMDWYIASFDYRFILSNGSTPVKQGFLLPGEEKYLMELAVESSGVSQVKLELRNVEWRRIDKHRIPDYKDYHQKHFNFEIDRINFISASQSQVSDKLPVSQVDFEVTNNTAYNFWNVGFEVLLYSGRRIAGVNYISLEQLEAGETRPVSVYWYEKLPSIGRVEVIPEVNILDDDVFMKFEGGIGEVK